MFLPSGEPCRPLTQSSIDCASRRKSSSSARLSAKSATTSCADSRRPSLANSTTCAKRFRICRSAATRRRMPGRWILTTTSSPLCRVAIVDLGDRRRGERLLVEVLEQLGGLVAEFLLEQLVYCLGVGGRYGVEQAAELTRQRFAECAGAGRDDLAELDVGGTQVGEGLWDLLDDLHLPGAPRGQLGDDAGGGPGELPTCGADAGRLERERNPIQFGDLPVLGELIVVVCQTSLVSPICRSAARGAEPRRPSRRERPWVNSPR